VIVQMATEASAPPPRGMLWYDTWTCSCAARDEKARRAWHGARGVLPGALLTAPIHGRGAHFVAHAVGGLEALAAEEIAATPGCADVHALVGRVVFRSDAPLDSLLRLRSAVTLSLLCWAAPAPSMPGEDLWPPPPAEAEETAERKLRWMARFEELLVEHVVPALRHTEAAWRRAVGMDADAPLSFRATVRRGGERSAACGASSQAMAAALGAVCAEDACLSRRWTVDLHAHDLELLLHWNEWQAVLEMPITRRPGGSRLADRAYLHGGMQGAVGWSLARLAGVRAGARVLDPMVGKGTVLLEASFTHPRAIFVGVDAEPTQLAAAAENRERAAAEQRADAATDATAAAELAATDALWRGPGADAVSFLHGDCTALPFAAGVFDCVACDLPFGKRHVSKLGISGLYARAVQEIARVVRDGGRAALFTTHRAMLSKLCAADPRWLPISRHEVQFGSMKAYILVAQRQAPPAAITRGQCNGDGYMTLQKVFSSERQ